MYLCVHCFTNVKHLFVFRFLFTDLYIARFNERLLLIKHSDLLKFIIV